MNDGDLPQEVPSPQAREETVQALCTHFAQDRLSVEEFEARLDRSYRAMTVTALKAVLADLPVLREETLPASAPVSAAPPASVSERGLIVAVLGGHERSGAWTPPRHLYVVAVCGGAELDFREARLPPGVTEVTILALMGGTGVIVPPGLEVHTNGVAIMGGFEQLDQVAGDPGPQAPVLKINGFAMMGGVEVRTRYPGESSREAKRRIRAERRARRIERRRG
ncbi:MAG: DUF1707 domain-containing protein [Gemmatimonadota bacterium]